MEKIISDLTGVMQATFTSGNWVNIAIVVFVAFIGAVSMRSYRQAPSMSLFAMFLLAILTTIYCVATGLMPGELSSWKTQLQAGWNDAMTMTGSTIVGYFVMFMVSIIILFTVKRIFTR